MAVRDSLKDSEAVAATRIKTKPAVRAMSFALIEIMFVAPKGIMDLQSRQKCPWHCYWRKLVPVKNTAASFCTIL
jgi:hypothetical protein